MIKLQDIKNLYTQCFPEDSEQVTNLLFANTLGEFNCHYLVDSGKLSCQLFVVDKQLYYLNNVVPLPYIVGLGTATDSRNKGLASKLMYKVMDNLTEPFLALYPFSHEFYQKMGFATVSYDYEYNKKGQTTDIDTVQKLYNKYTDNKDFYIIKNQQDFDLMNALTKTDNASFYLTDPLGYTNGEQTILIDAIGKNKGTMVRIINLEKAIALSKITLPPTKIVDKFLPKNNVTITAKNGKMERCDNHMMEIDIEKLCLIMFGVAKDSEYNIPNIKGHILDRY